MAQNAELIKYIKEQLAKGVDKDQIRQTLRKTGWSPLDVDVAFYAAQGNTIVASPTLPTAKDKANKKKGASGFLYFLLILSIMAFMGASVYAYMRSQNPEPGVVMQQMMTNMQNVKSYAYAGKIETTLKLSDVSLSDDLKNTYGSLPFSNSGKMSLNYQGIVNEKNEADPVYTVATQFQSGEEKDNVNLEARIFKEKWYFMVNSAIKNEYFDLSKVKDLWFLLDLATLQREISNEPTVTPTLKPSLSAEKKAQLTAAIAQSQALTITALPGEIVSGVDTFHYRYDVNQVEAMKLMDQIASIVDEKHEKVTAQQLKELEEATKGSTINGEIWIGRNDKLVYKITAQIINKIPNTQNEMTTTVTSQFGRYNDDLTAEVPANFSDWSEAFKKVMITPSVSGTPTGSITPTPSKTPTPTVTPSKTPSVTPTQTVPLGNL